MKRKENRWGLPGPHWDPEQPTSFEQMAQRLGLAPAEYRTSYALREWAEEHKNRKYIPDELLKAWGLVPHVD